MTLAPLTQRDVRSLFHACGFALIVLPLVYVVSTRPYLADLRYQNRVLRERAMELSVHCGSKTFAGNSSPGSAPTGGSQ